MADLNQRKAAKIKRDFIKKSKVLTRVLSSQNGVNVHIRGNRAYTSGSEVVLPSGDFLDENYVELLEGAIDHEIGHIDESDFATLVEAQKHSPLLKHITNLFEDIRMERSRIKKWPGSKSRLLGTVKQAISRGWFKAPTEEDDELSVVLSYLLYTGRGVYIEQHPVNGFAQVASQLLAQKINKKTVSGLQSTLRSIPAMESSWDALELARQVINLLEDEKEEQEKEQQQQDQEQNDSQDDSDAESDENEADGNSDSGSDGDANDNDCNDQSSESSTEETESEGEGGKSDSSTDEEAEEQQSSDYGENKQSSEGSSAQDGAEPEQTPGEIAEKIKQILEADEGEMMRDLHEQMREALEQEATEAQSEGRADGWGDAVKVSKKPVLGVLDKSEALNASRKVTQPLQRTLMDMNKTDRQWRKRGSNLDGDKLAGVACGQMNVFKHESIHRSPNTAVSILVDRSSSMGWDNDPMSTANNCTYALACSFERLKGVSTEVLYYPFGNDIHLAKGFKEKARNCAKHFEVHADGGTPTGMAMKAAMRSLALRQEPKKLLFVLTDGDPNCTVEVAQALELAECLGIQVVAIGIQTSEVAGFEGEGFVTVEHVSELPVAIKTAIQQSLLSAA